MHSHPHFARAAHSAACAFAPGMAQAVTLRVANQGAVQSMDPHPLNETRERTFTANICEPRVGRDKRRALAPALATAWKQTSPTVRRFDLRRGVGLHDGTAFDADDVVFSFKRAGGEGSDLKSNTPSIEEVRKVGDFAVEIETLSPFPILPEVVSPLAIMSGRWCEDHFMPCKWVTLQ